MLNSSVVKYNLVALTFNNPKLAETSIYSSYPYCNNKDVVDMIHVTWDFSFDNDISQIMCMHRCDSHVFKNCYYTNNFKCHDCFRLRYFLLPLLYWVVVVKYNLNYFFMF